MPYSSLQDKSISVQSRSARARRVLGKALPPTFAHSSQRPAMLATAAAAVPEACVPRSRAFAPAAAAPAARPWALRLAAPRQRVVAAAAAAEADTKYASWEVIYKASVGGHLQGKRDEASRSGDAPQPPWQGKHEPARGKVARLPRPHPSSSVVAGPDLCWHPIAVT